MAIIQPLSLKDVIDAAAARTSDMPDPLPRIEQYRNAVGVLIENVQSWLKEEIAEGKVTSHPAKMVRITEQGQIYNVVTWSFSIGGRYVTLEPRGTWVIGAYGRVDLAAQPGASVVLTLDENFQWNLPTKGRTKISYSKLDTVTFAEALARALQIPSRRS